MPEHLRVATVDDLPGVVAPGGARRLVALLDRPAPSIAWLQRLPTALHTEVRFARVGDVLIEDSGVLTAAEQARNARIRHSADRDAHRAAHLLVRRVAARLLGAHPDEVEIAQVCPECHKADHGRPHVVGHPELFVSLSHTRDRVAAIASTRPCGVDVEPVRPVMDSVRRLVLTDAEAQLVAESADPATTFARLWVAKETMVKAGLGNLSTAQDWPALTAPVIRQWTGGSAARPHVGAWLVSDT